MPPIDTSSPGPITQPIKDAEESPFLTSMLSSSTDRPVDSYNLPLKYLLQVTDSELQNMSRQVPTSQQMAMAGDSTTAITQLVLRPVSSGQSNVLQDNVILSDIMKVPVSERGIEKYQLKPDTNESQGFKSVYPKQQCDQYESNPVSYSNFKSRTFKSQQPQGGEKFRQQISGDNIVGRKRKLPTKPGRHICHFCGLGCAKPSVLEKHIRSHTGERPYPCVACGVFFKTKSNLYKHNKSRAHAVKAGLGQIPTSTSSEMTSTEGDADNEDANESEETQTETSDTDGENEEKQMKHFRKEQGFLELDPLRLKRGYSESDAKIRIEEFQEKKSTSLTESCFLGDQYQSVTMMTSSGSNNTTNTVTSVNIHGEISKGSSLELHTDNPLHHSANLDGKSKLSVPSMTGHTPVYFPDKRFYDVPQISKLLETHLNEESKEDILVPVADNVVSGSLQSSHAKESVKSFNLHDKQTVSSKEHVPLSLSLHTSHSKSLDKSIHPINKNSEETKTISSLSITGSTPTDKKRLEEHILQIISKNDTIVNTPMSEPPRQKRIFRQHSDQPNTSGSKLEELPQSVSMTKVSIPSISSIPLAPIPDDNDLNKDLCLSPQSYFTPLISEKKEISNPILPELLSPSSKTENLNEKLSSSNICSGLQGSQEIKIEIKLPKTGSNVVTIATPSQSIIGKPNMQFSPTSVVTTVVNSSSFVKNPENSVIKGLLLKGKTSSLTSPNPPSRAIKEKSSSVDEITTMKNESALISFQREDIGIYSVSNVGSVYSKASQLQKFRHSKSSSSSTSMDSHTSPITITERRPDRPALVKCSSFEKDVPPGYLSHSFSSDRESSIDIDLERGEWLKDDKHDSNAVLFNTENYDLVAPKKKGRPKGSKNKPKMINATVSVQGLSSTSLATSSSSSQQNSILLATLKQPSLQQPYTEPSSDLPPWKVILKNKLIKRSMSTERMLSQEKDSDSFSAQSTISTSPSTESSSSLGPIRASSFEMLKQPIDNERNERNSPLKKRKVPSEFLQSDPILRPGVTRAGSEPLMSQMGLNAASSKSLSEKRLSSLPETLEYKYSASQVTNSLNNPICSGPVTVPVVVAQPIVIPMKFSDSIQSATPSHVPVTSGWSKLNKVALSTHCDIQLSLPAIPATSTSSKQVLQLPLVTSLVVSKFPKDNKIEATNLTEEFSLLNTSKESSTSVSTDINGLSETNTEPVDVTSSIAVPVSSCPPSLLSGNTALTSLKEVSTVSTTGCNTSKQQIMTSLQSLTQTTFCCVQRLQPMYVPQGENQKISMYSNWRVSKHTPHPSNLTPQMFLFLYNSKNTSDPIYSVAKNKSTETIMTESSEWNLYSKRKLLPMSSSVVEKLSNGVLTIDATVATEVVKLPTDIMISDKKDIGLWPQSENKVDSLLTSCSTKETVTNKEPKRVRIFQGGFRSTEEYTYIRGRGRGKYVCEECGIRCKKPSMLKKHIRTHTDLRPYHCRHCRFSFKTKGNLTKHMKSKAHQKKCLELGIDPVPIIVDESQIDSEALAAQSAIAKETKSLDDENEDDEEDDDDIDDEEETDDADGQFSDSEESARTSFERMDTNETIDTSIDRDSECGMLTHSSSLDAVETSRIPEVNSSEVSESEHASGSEIAVSMTSVYVGTSGLTATISSASVAMITANQSQIDNEIARSLLDLSQRQVQPSEDTAKEISANVPYHTKTDTSEKTLVRQYSFDMADSPERGMSRSPSQTEHPEIQVFSADECEKFPSSVNIREKEEKIVIVQREASPISHERKNFKRQQSYENEESNNLSNSQALMTLKTTTKSPTPCLLSGLSVNPALSESSSTQKFIFVSEIPQNLQTIVANDTGQTSISTVSLSFREILPNGNMGPVVGQVLQGSSSTTLNSTNSTTFTLSPFQFQHPFQAFERSSEIKPEEINVKVKEDTSSTVIIPLVNTSDEIQSPVCNPKTVFIPQTSCVQTANGVATSIMHDSDSKNHLQSQPLIGQVVLPNQQAPNNSSLVSIIVTNQAYQTTDGLTPQNQNKPENGFQSVHQRIQSPLHQHSNSESCISESRCIEMSSKLGSNIQVNNMIAIKPSNYISEGSHQPLAVFTPTKIVGQKLHSEQQSSTFERHSPVMFVDDIQIRNLYEQKKLAEQQTTSFKIQPSTMISNVHQISRQSPKTHVERGFSPTLFADKYSTTRQHQTDHSVSTQPKLEEFFPVHQNSADNFSSTQQHQRERYSPMRQPNIEQYSAPQNQVNRYSPNQQLNIDRYPKTQQQMESYSPTQPLNADKYSSTKQINMDKYSTTQLQLERYPATQQQKMKHYNLVHQSDVDRYSPTRQLHMDRYSTVQQHHVDRYSPTSNIENYSKIGHMDRYSIPQQHSDLLPSQNYVERASPYHSLEILSSPRHHRFSPTRQLGDRISPTRHVNRLSPTRQHVSRLSPTHLVDRFSPTWQYTDKLSPTRQGVERLSPSRQHSERLSPSRQYLTRFSPTRQTNRMSQNVDLVSNPKPHVDMSLECQSPTRQIIRMSPQPFTDKISGTAQINRVPSKLNETSSRIPLEPSSSNLPEQQSTDRSIPESGIEKHSSYRHLEPQVSSKILGCNATSKSNETPCAEKQHVVTSISTSCSQTMQKSFKEDLNRCRDCSKKFSTSQEYTVHRRQHMKTHRSEDSTTSHTRPHLHKCFHSEGHADSRSMSTEEIPKPPDCVNCKVDFWKQNHLPKHLWAKTHKMTEKLRNKHSSSSDSEPANLVDSISSVTAVTPSRVETIPASEKALDLSRDESLTVTQTNIANTSSIITTASLTNAANLQSVSVSSEPTFRLSEEDNVPRNKIPGLETPNQPQFLLHQRPLYQNYLEPYSDSSIKVKDEPLESDKWSSVRNNQWLRVTNSTEMTGTGIIPLMSVMAVTSPNMCNLCQAVFPSHHQLQSHILVHKNHRPFVCEYCDAGFAKKQSLKIHLQTHSLDKPYICDICGDTFASADKRSDHYQVHSEAHHRGDDTITPVYQQVHQMVSSLPKAYTSSQELYMTLTQLPSNQTPLPETSAMVQQNHVPFRTHLHQDQQYLESCSPNVVESPAVTVSAPILTPDSSLISKP